HCELDVLDRADDHIVVANAAPTRHASDLRCREARWLVPVVTDHSDRRLGADPSAGLQSRSWSLGSSSSRTVTRPLFVALTAGPSTKPMVSPPRAKSVARVGTGAPVGGSTSTAPDGSARRRSRRRSGPTTGRRR